MNTAATPRDVLVEAGRLAAARSPYAFATVVRVERPTSAREGNHALITPDGGVTGWIGGACSEPTVVREALRALADGKPRLVAIEGSCASEGLVEVFIEPQLPEPRARDRRRRARGGDARRSLDPHRLARRAVDREGGGRNRRRYARSRRRGGPPRGPRDAGRVHRPRREPAERNAALAALRDSGVGEADLARIRCPAGLDLGPSSQEEIAVAILAEVVAWRHARAGPATVQVAGVKADEVDPVCGMSVSIETATESAELGGVRYYFCCAGCRRRFESDPDRYVEVNVQ